MFMLAAFFTTSLARDAHSLRAPPALEAEKCLMKKDVNSLIGEVEGYLEQAKKNVMNTTVVPLFKVPTAAALTTIDACLQMYEAGSNVVMTLWSCPACGVMRWAFNQEHMLIDAMIKDLPDSVVKTIYQGMLNDVEGAFNKFCPATKKPSKAMTEVTIDQAVALYTGVPAALTKTAPAFRKKCLAKSLTNASMQAMNDAFKLWEKVLTSYATANPITATIPVKVTLGVMRTAQAWLDKGMELYMNVACPTCATVEKLTADVTNYWKVYVDGLQDPAIKKIATAIYNEWNFWLKMVCPKADL